MSSPFRLTPCLLFWLLPLACAPSTPDDGECARYAFALAPVGLLAPFEYSTLVFGTALGFLVWGDTPAWTTILGAAIVVAAGLLNLRAGRGESARRNAARG